MEPAKDVGVQSDPPVFWNREDTLALLSAYETQKDRLGKDFRFKNYMWVAISDALKKEGKSYTSAQCENRFRVLVRCYRRRMDTNLKSARIKKNFEYQDQMDRIMKDEINIKHVSLLKRKGVSASGGKMNIQISDVCSESEPVPVSKELLINTGKSNVNSDIICSQPEPVTSGSKQIFLIRGKTNVTSDGIISEAQSSPNTTKNYLLISANPNVNNDGISKPKENESSRSGSKQLFIITGKPNLNSDRIGGEPEPAPGSNKQLFILSGKHSVNNNKISGEPERTPNSKQLFIIGGKSSVNSDINSVAQPTPSSKEPEQAASSSKQSFINPPKLSFSPSEKGKKLKQVFLEQIRADRKLYYQKKLEVDKERLQGLEKRNDELLELKKMKLQQTERLIACEEEKLKCEQEKVLISREKLKMYGRLVELQEESNEILRSINDHLDFLL